MQIIDLFFLLGDDKLWELAEAQLAEALNEFAGEGNWKVNPGDGAFYACSLLSDITLNSGLTIIGYAMFYMGIKVKSITIPSSVTSVGMTLFLISYKFIYILRRFSI